MYYDLNSLKGGSITGGIKGDTTSLDYSSHVLAKEPSDFASHQACSAVAT